MNAQRVEQESILEQQIYLMHLVRRPWPRGVSAGMSPFRSVAEAHFLAGLSTVDMQEDP